MTGLRINLGSGEVPLPGFVNVDALPDAPGVDVVARIDEGLPFPDGEADLLYASHLLEHFPTDQTPSLLAEWRRVLKPGGSVLIAVPNLLVIAAMLHERPGWFTPPHGPWLGALYGGQKDEFDFHKTGFTPAWMAHLLSEADFGEIRQVDRFDEIPARDGSQSPLPFGTNVSLNMRAVAGGSNEELDPHLIGRTQERFFDGVDRVLHRGMAYSTILRSRLMKKRLDRIHAALGAGDPAD